MRTEGRIQPRRLPLCIRSFLIWICLCCTSNHASASSSSAPSAGVAAAAAAAAAASSSPETNGMDRSKNVQEERYSRQAYTLGAHAQKQIRSDQTIVVLDGACGSGLIYETAKNLALMGVRNLLVVENSGARKNKNRSKEEGKEEDEDDIILDDLGRMVLPQAGPSLTEQLRGLNPTIAVTAVTDRAAAWKMLFHDRRTKNNKYTNAVYVVAEPRDNIISIDEVGDTARRHGLKCVVVETVGVFGRVLCDFDGGPSSSSHHTVVDADGEVPLLVPLEKLVVVNNDDCDDDDGTTTTIMVHAVEGEHHDVSKGDVVEFQDAASGSVLGTCVVEKVLSPIQFRATTTTTTTTEMSSLSPSKTPSKSADAPSLVAAIRGTTTTTFRRIKTPLALPYVSLREALARAMSNKHDDNDDIFTPCDLMKSFDTERRGTIMAAFGAVFAAADWDEFVRQVMAQKMPLPGVKNAANDNDEKTTTTTTTTTMRILRQFWRGRRAKFAPVQAIMGAVAAQEAIKAITGVYTPVRQIMLFDADEVLPDDDDNVIDDEPMVPSSSSSSSGLRTLLGNAVVDRLHDTNVFVVGAGAIGCELLKNLAALQVGAGQRGKVVVTDMDTIEASNLSRQLLFREGDLGKFKSLAAKEAMARLNPAMNVEAHSSKVGATNGGSSTPFDETFWSKLDIVLNALDNVEARLYMDGQCVSHRKALVDAGTMGPKGNVQVVVPHQSESYASSADPPEPAIPVCTVKSFPYAISHTIQWGKELFEDTFQRRPIQANAILDQLEGHDLKTVIRTIFRDHGADRAIDIAIDTAQDLEAVAHGNAGVFATVQSHVVEWAADLAHRLFYEASAQLLKEHPLDSKDEDGEPFWSGTRRPPKLLLYTKEPLGVQDESINQNLVDFIRFAAKLRRKTLPGKAAQGDQSIAHDEIVAALTKRGSAAAVESAKECQESPPEKVRRLLAGATTIKERLLPIDFEKDDEANGHVAFIAASSNLRAIAYGIPAVSVDETRRVAGNIIPAMVTTTALVSGLSCIELIKLVQGRELQKHRNAFVNLALPFFAFTAPVPADTLPGVQGRSYTLWDRIDIREGPISHSKGGISIKHILRTIKEKAADRIESVDVASISYGPFMIYTNFLHEGDDEILNQKLWSLLQETVAEDATAGYDPDAPYYDFDVVLEDVDTGEAVELPPVRVHRFLGI